MLTLTQLATRLVQQKAFGIIPVEQVRIEYIHDLTRTMFFDHNLIEIDSSKNRFVLYDHFYCRAHGLRLFVEKTFDTKLEHVKAYRHNKTRIYGIYKMLLTEEQKLEYTMTYFS